MRTHSLIIADAEGPTALHRALGLPDEKIHAVRSWAQRDSIPSEHWRAIAAAGFATLEELAAAAEARRLRPTPAAEAAA